MKKGDTVYVKKGPFIVGKGAITREYQYNPDILKGTDADWEHYVSVDWERNFPEFRLVLGADRITVLKLYGDRLDRILEAEKEAKSTRN